MYTMGYYFVMRKKEILPLETTWIKLEDMMLSEINQKKKKKKAVTVSSHLYIKSKKKIHRMGYRAGEGRDGQMLV